MAHTSLTRRSMLQLGAGLAALTATGGAALAQGKTKPIKVASIYTVPVEQQWVSRLHKALNAAKDRGDITYKWSENVANNDYERIMRQYSEEGTDLVVGEIFGVERAARRVAASYPKVAYLMGSSFGPVKPNLSVFDNFIHEPSYLTGMVAGKATKSNTIGMVGGYAIPEVNRLMQAFMEGAKSVNPNVKFLVTFINSWYDPPKAKEAAFAMIDRGADVMYAERFGVSDAAKEKGVKVIGNVIDTAAQYPGTVLASALWHMEPSIDRAIKAVLGGTLRGDRLRSVQLHGAWRREPRDGREAGGARDREAGQGEGKGDPGRHVPRQHQRRRAEVVVAQSVLILSEAADVRRMAANSLPPSFERQRRLRRRWPSGSDRSTGKCPCLRPERAAGPASCRHRQALRRARGERRDRSRVAARGNTGAARRERRRQDHADEHPVRPLRGRRRDHRGERTPTA